MTEFSATSNAQAAAVADSSLPMDKGVHQLGYRGWSGSREPGWTRWTVIAAVGVRRAWQNQWLKRMLFFAWLPALWFGIGFLVWEQAALYPEWRQVLTPILSSMPQTPAFNQIRELVREGDLATSRHTFWAWLLNLFFRYPQAVLMVLVVGMISPPLISQDIRSRAFLLYFSRPLTRVEYLLGKMASLWAYLAMITVAPALVLYVLGVGLSPSLSVISATWDLPLRILGASIVLMLPTSAIALCFSSLTQESRYACFGWFAVWILGWFTYGAVTTAEALTTEQQMQQQMQQQHRQFRHHRVVEVPEVKRHKSVWRHLSLYHMSDEVQNWVFGFDELKDVLASIVILVAVTTVSLGVLYHRISVPMRV